MTTQNKGAKPAPAKTRPLTPKQARFVEEYIVDLNATQAAIRAGYSPKHAESQAYQLLQKTPVQIAIQKAQDARSERTAITADRVLQELAKIGFADIRRVVRWGSTTLIADSDGQPMPYHGLALTASEEIDDDTAAAISEITEGPQGLKVKMHDKKGALVDIGRHLGMFKDKLEHSGPDGSPIQARMAIEFVTAPDYPDDDEGDDSCR